MRARATGRRPWRTRRFRALALLTVTACSSGRAGGTPAGATTPAAPAVAAAPAASTHRRASPDDSVPRTILVRGDWLADARSRVRGGDPMLRPAYEALLRAADSALLREPLAVTQKRRLPPSGNPHDYLSLAPYWWPDTTRPDGLPYVRRDGVVNPESRRDHDGWRLQPTIQAARTLALAHYFTGEPRYAAGAARLLRVFFVDSATRMNPNLRFAQGVPGVTEGRGTGIIDTRHMPQLVDALRLLDGAPGWTAADREAMLAWCRAYLDWLRTSEHGRDEAAAENNHGTWYDAQMAALALFVGDTAAAREAIGVRARRRLAAHVRPDGRQPLELERTRPLHYSLFNLDAFTMLAELGRHVGVDLWHEAPAGAGSLRSALRFVAPYADPANEWPTPQVTPAGPDVFLHPLRRAAAALHDSVLARAVHHLPPPLAATDLSRLLYPDPLIDAAGPDSLADHALRFAAERLHRAATTLDPADGYPRMTGPDGRWTQLSARAWTSGFFAGALWYMYQLSGDTAWRALAERWTEGLEEVKRVTTTHDLGFMLFDSFGHGYLLTGDPHYKDVVLEGSRSLATRFDSTVGAIKSWDTQRARDHRRTWAYPVIVDNLMNLEMLFWAARHGGDPEWARMAERHALVSARAHVRPDGSTAHVALFDTATGALLRTVTWQGYSDSSTWSRGQAWAIHGLTAAYGRTGDRELLDAARRAADWYIAHLPADAVPYWDFRHPEIPRTERDASASAIAASGLYDLARRVDGDDGAGYRAAADRTLRSLASAYLTEGTPSAAVLQHAVGQRPQGVEVDVGLIYADYYFVEALLRRRGLFLE